MSLSTLARHTVTLAVAAAAAVMLLAAPGRTDPSAGASPVVQAPKAATAADLGRMEGIVPPHNPPRDIWPKPDYTFPYPSPEYSTGSKLPPCWKWGPHYDGFVAVPASPRCVAAELAATDNARRAERVGRAILPRHFARLSNAEQLLVLVDIERVGRGEPPVLGLSARANELAQFGAKHNEDPVPGPGVRGATGAFASNWAGALSTLDASYEWMYTDGWDGKRTFNFDCTSAHAPGCWGHRDNILVNSARMPCFKAPCSIVMGAGFVAKGFGGSDGYNSYSELFLQISGTGPPLYYTWKDALEQGARG